MNLKRYFPDLHLDAFKDESGVVYKDGERIALDNTTANGYSYINGEIRFDTSNGCIGEHIVTTPLVFVGAIPNGITEQVFKATISALSESNLKIISASIDKDFIAINEGIEIDKFVGVAMIRVEFEIEQSEIYDPSCHVDVCRC